MAGGAQRKGVLDASGFSAFRVDVDWGLNFLSVIVDGSISN